MTYNGSSLEELQKELRDRLGIPNRVRMEVYNRRVGGFGRKRLTVLTQDCTDVYVLLKVEDSNADNQRNPTIAE